MICHSKSFGHTVSSLAVHASDLGFETELQPPGKRGALTGSGEQRCSEPSWDDAAVLAAPGCAGDFPCFLTEKDAYTIHSIVHRDS